VDNYWNAIITKEDFDFICNYQNGYEFFHKVHCNFIRDKLAEQRKLLRKDYLNV
jgi:hypothetical protein